MCHIERLHVRNAPESRDLAVDLFKTAVRLEQALPGILVVARHIVVGMVARHDHQGAEHDLRITCCLHGFDDLVAGGLLRLALDRADEGVFIAQFVHLRLHLAVGDLRDMRRAVAHEDERRAVFLRGLQALETSVFDSLGHDRLRDGCLVLIHDGHILADFAQKRLRHADGLEIARHCSHGFHELVVLRAVHQVRRLNDEILHAVCLRARQCLVDIVDDFLIAGLHMVDDDLGRKRPAHGPVRIGLLNGLLDPADILCAAVVEGGAEAHHQDLVLADLIRVQRIVQGGVACVAAEIIGIRLFSFHHLLLGISQRVPRIARRFDVRVGRLGALLYIDRIDQCCTLGCKLFIRFRAFRRSGSVRCRRGFRRGLFLFSLRGSFRRLFLLCLRFCSRCFLRGTCAAASRTAAAAGEKSTRQHSRHHDRCQFPFHNEPPRSLVHRNLLLHVNRSAVRRSACCSLYVQKKPPSCKTMHGQTGSNKEGSKSGLSQTAPVIPDKDNRLLLFQSLRYFPIFALLPCSVAADDHSQAGLLAHGFSGGCRTSLPPSRQRTACCKCPEPIILILPLFPAQNPRASEKGE